MATLAVLLLTVACQQPLPGEVPEGDVAGWPSYGSGPGGGHYSRASQITRDNVRFLKKVWEHRSGDIRERDVEAGVYTSSAFEATPILADATLYYCSPFNKVFAVDAETGVEQWRFDPKVSRTDDLLPICRGVSHWRSNRAGFCERRILEGTLDGRLIALDAATGRPCPDFGDGGQVDVERDLSKHSPAEYAITSPPAILGDLVITGSLVLDNQRVDVPSGVVRAYDVRSGALRWAWNPVPPALQQRDTDGSYRSGTTNVWSIISVDPARNLVFVPTGNTSPDFYGGHREHGLDAYSSSVVALDGATGKLVWHYQFVHHDVWDYDTPAQPALVDVQVGGQQVPALVQVTKMGLTFILNRETGKPIYPVEERPVPQAPVAGEYLSPTQPFPGHIPPLVNWTVAPEDAWGLTFWDQGQCRDRFAALRNEGIYTPPSLAGSMFVPANSGGNNWGSPAIDPERRIMVVVTMHMVSSLALATRESSECEQPGSGGAQLGTPYCARVMPVLSPWSLPCTKPPWSTLDAVDLAAGKILWRQPMGSRFWIKGLPAIGGPAVTASGLVFVAAAMDPYLRAHDLATGEILWETKLPTTAQSVPMTYQLREGGRQFVVLAAGGHWGGFSKPGDHLMAWALPAPR